MKVLVFCSLMILPTQLLAAVCLRTPNWKPEGLPALCANSAREIYQALLPNDTAEALEKVRLQVEKQPQQAEKLWIRFFESLRRRAWGPLERRMAEQIHWRTDQFGEWWDSRGSLPEQDPQSPMAALPAGLEDLQIYRNGEPVSHLVWTAAGVSHWLVFSSAVQPKVFWGTGAELESQLRKWQPTAWLSGDCRLQKKLSFKEQELKLFGEECTQRDPATLSTEAGSGLKIDNRGKQDFTGSYPPSSSAEVTTQKKIPWWWLFAAAVLVPTAHHLSNKTLVIGTR